MTLLKPRGEDGGFSSPSSRSVSVVGGGGSETEQGPERDFWKTGSVISEEGQVSVGEVGGLGPTWGLL